MKRLLAAVLALLLLTACGTKPEQTSTDPVEEPVSTVEKTETSKDPVENLQTEEPEPVEIPVEVVEPQEEFTEMTLDVQFETKTAEGLLEDAVAYVYEYPEFTNLDGAGTINAYYASLMEFLADYAKSTVLPEAQQRHTIADVTGTFEIIAADEGLQLGIVYTVSVKFADSEEAESFDRTDVFHPDTGTLLGTN